MCKLNKRKTLLLHGQGETVNFFNTAAEGKFFLKNFL